MEFKHSEYHYRSNLSDTVVIFTHGIQGSPLQFDYMIEKLNGMYSIENLLLPGHGKTTKEFAHSSMVQWQNYVDERVRRLQHEYKNIILVGHSMGSLLSIQTAISYPGRIRGLFLTAVPLTIRVRFSYIKNNLIVAFSKNNYNEIIAAARKGNSILASTPFEYLAGAPRYIDLFKKSKLTRELLDQLQLPLVIVQSADDEIVSNKSLSYVEKRQNIQVIIVNKSGHYYYSQEAQEQISNALIRFISEVALK